MDSIEGTFIDMRIRKVIEMGSSRKALYTPRSGGIIKNMHQFTEKQIDLMIKENSYFINYFEYSKILGTLTDEQQLILKEDPEDNFRISNYNHKQWYLQNK